MRSIGSAVNRSSMDEANFCKSAIYACDAALYFAQLLSAKAENLAAMEGNPYRKAELLESAAILRKVPAKTSRNL